MRDVQIADEKSGTEEEIDSSEGNQLQNDVQKDLNTIQLTLSDADIERAGSDLGIEG